MAAMPAIDSPGLEVHAPDPTGADVATIEDLRVTFRRRGRPVHALRGVSLTIRSGEILGLVGESGSGKSVLGLSLLGLLDPKADVGGEVTVRGQDMVHSPQEARRAMRRSCLGAVFQDPMTSLNPTMRVGHQVAEAAGSAAEAERLLGAVGIPDPHARMRAYPHELSGGLRQRVMIAMAIASGPALVIADEPTTALDVTVQSQVLRLLRSLRDDVGCSIVMITHDLGVAAQVADRVAVMYAGRLAELGETPTVLGDAAHPYTLGLMRSRLSLDTDRGRPLVALPGDVPNPSTPEPGCAFAPRCDFAEDACLVGPPDAVEIDPGHRSACIVPKPEVRRRELELVRSAPEVSVSLAKAESATSAVIELRKVEKTFAVGSGLRHKDQLQALRGINLTVAPGEAVAIVGESGSGKSTLLRVAAGLARHESGDLLMAEEAMPQMVFQDSGASLTPWMTVGELIGARLKGLGRKERAARVVEALGHVGLPPDVSKAKAAQLSGGQRQRVCLARATIVPPRVLLCDEPTSALDVSLAASVINLIGRLRRELGMSVVFVTHDLSVARIVADRIAVMYLGRIVEIGDADTITRDPAHPYTRALISAVPDAGKEPAVLKGDPASAMRPPPGCSFNPRCPKAVSVCSDANLEVPLVPVPRLSRASRTHMAACVNLESD
jgi:peptide/nickel transport system ATP-binding protein